MNKYVTLLLTVIMVCAGGVKSSDASDWDKAGKALTIVEGLRLFTGGKVDLVGNLAGFNRNKSVHYTSGHHRSHNRGNYRKQKRHHYDTCRIEKNWVPHYSWEKKHIPEHEEYDEEYGKVIIGAHYVKYRVQEGGHWEKKETCH